MYPFLFGNPNRYVMILLLLPRNKRNFLDTFHSSQGFGCLLIRHEFNVLLMLIVLEILPAGFRSVEDPARPPREEPTIHRPPDGAVQYEVSRASRPATLDACFAQHLPIELASNYSCCMRTKSAISLDAQRAENTFIKGKSSTRAKKTWKTKTISGFASIGFTSR